MEISEIKSQLTITQVLSHYNLTPDRNNRLCCPWHSDKTPSLQIYPMTNTWTCFSSNCDAGSGDQIEMIQRMESEAGRAISKHEAIMKAKVLIGNRIITNSPSPRLRRAEKSLDLNKLYEKFKNNYKKSTKAQEYAKSRGLEIELGYNGSSWAHLKNCLVFPLRNEAGEIVSFYGRSIIGTDKNTHFYSKGRTGLYPSWPDAKTKTLILTESVIDCLHVEGEKLALYGTNGLTDEHVQAIKKWAQFSSAKASANKEMILFFDGDEAGNQAVQKVGKKLQEILPEIKISYVETPLGTDVNSLVTDHPDSYRELLQDLITNRKGFSFLPTRKSGGQASSSEFSTEIVNDTKPKVDSKSTNTGLFAPKLDTNNKHNLRYTGLVARYSIKGGIVKNGMDAMKVTLVIEIDGSYTKSRSKLDLYEDKQVEKISREASEKLGLESSEIEKDLNRLTDLLDEYREQEKTDKKVSAPMMSPAQREKCLAFLRKEKVIKNIDKLIEQSGVVGEENNRIFLFCIAAAHKMPQTLHALVQGSSGSGKTHLIKQITDFMPKENVIRLTRVTESSFYNYGELELRGKLVVIEDYDGLKEEAEYAFRELQSNEEIISSTSVKDEKSGEIKARIRKVKGPIGSLSATTRSEIYEDNLSRCFVIAVDESSKQTQRIIKYQNEAAAGIIDKAKQERFVQFIMNCMRLLRPKEVINPYAAKLNLPPAAFKIRRLNSNFQSFIRQITLMNQYQRKTDAKGRLVTQLEDIETAVEIMFDSIVLKIDELDGGLRLFYERLKEHIVDKAHQNQEKPSLQDFTQREIRHKLRISKTSLQRYINDLVTLEYLQQSGGHHNRGYKYKITYWDDIAKIRLGIKDYLYQQIERIKETVLV